MYVLYTRAKNDLEIALYTAHRGTFSDRQLKRLRWLAADLSKMSQTRFEKRFADDAVLEIGPRRTIETPYSSNAVAILHRVGLRGATRVEMTRRHAIDGDTFFENRVDPMTEELYPHGIVTFASTAVPQKMMDIDLIGQDRTALEKANADLGLGMDTIDLDYYVHLFVNIKKRNPTDVELLQLGNANSEHSRHWFIKGRMIIDGEVMPQTLLEIAQEPLRRLGAGHRILKAFDDNAGVTRGFEAEMLIPRIPGYPSELAPAVKVVHITATAETHNHPTYIAPFPGAATGAGGRIRDTAAVGRGGFSGIGVAGYYTGNLFIEGYEIPGEVVGKDRPSMKASALSILIDGSNGLSAYGNEFGEPVTLGFFRTFGQMVAGERREPLKPILYSGGIGHLFDGHLYKEKPQVGMRIVQIGGPTHPIGVGGGSASSMAAGQNSQAHDLNSVQRGDPETGNRTNRVIRSCAEMGDDNPIASIHDQGAGGSSNVLTELMDPLGGVVDIGKIILADKMMSPREIWSAEAQERYGLLVQPEHMGRLQTICERERVNCEDLGAITGSGNVVVEDSERNQTCVDLTLTQILTEMPQKTFTSTRRIVALPPLALPEVSVAEAIRAVFGLPGVGSKGFLVNKVDRSVTGHVVQQQCRGIAQIAIADNSINAQSYFGVTGAVSTLGERPSVILIDPRAGGRMVVGEALTNMASAVISSFGDICSRGNEMWAAKRPHEGALLYDVMHSAFALMGTLGISSNGGKDSISMEAKVEGEAEVVKSPGSLVILAYAPMPDVTKHVTPDIKRPGESSLYLIDLGRGKNRLGGSALAQAYNQLGNECPDVDDPKHLKDAFLAVQQMVEDGLVLAVHDRSDGGLITTVAEMCMASQCGFTLYAQSKETVLAELFSEELGFVLEVLPEDEMQLLRTYDTFDILPMQKIGMTRADQTCEIIAERESVCTTTTVQLRLWWERTSYEIEKLQMNEECAKEEYRGLTTHFRSIHDAPSYRLSFTPRATPPEILSAADKPRVAIVREEGTNGDREMQAAWYAAGFAPHDVAMSDLIAGRSDLEGFRGVAYAGGFSFMDVFGSAKGWAASILFNDRLRDMFDRFYAREDTFSLGVCNGCPLMAYLGWVPWKGIEDRDQPRFVHNVSRKFESRWVQVEILPSPSIMLRGMAGSRLGIWVAHGEGLLHYPDQSLHREVETLGLAPLRYLDPHGNQTEKYPYNPNGSWGGATALCTSDGRHLAMMPHPERAFLKRQWSWMPEKWKHLEASPWLQMFQNAREWCTAHRQ